MKNIIVIIICTLFCNNLNAQCGYFIKISEGGATGHCLGLKNDNTIWGWGGNLSGQLGSGTTSIRRTTPLQIGIGNNWINISSNGSHSLGITSDGKLWAWGNNTYGQLGDGSTGDKYIPAQIGTATNWVSISAGSNHTLGLTSDGKLWAWGANYYGQVGNGTINNINIPIQIGTATNWTRIAAGGDHSLGITSDGKAWAWGYNYYGQLGISSYTNKSVPTQIGTSSNWSFLYSGKNFSLGLTNDGKAWGWGSNINGNLGIGTYSDKYEPTQIGIATNWATLSAGSVHSLGITTDGRAFAWGYNYYGGLGDGTSIDKNIPTQIGMNNNWVSIEAGNTHSAGITADGKTWTWGYNFVGQLGNGSTVNKFIPTLISQASLAMVNSTSTQNQQSIENYATDCLSLISTIRQFGANPLTGITNSKVWIESTQPSQFVKRHYEITPSNNASSATGKITLYFTQAEFDAFNLINTTKLPSGPNDLTGIANILLEKRSGISNDGTGLPSSYTSAIITIDPVDSDIFWNNTNNYWEITFEVTGFSGFFLKVAGSILPLNWLNFIGNINNQKQAVLKWKVEETNVANFIVEKSNDGVTFNPINTIISKGDGNNNYNFTDSPILNSIVYYRIKQADNSGRSSYSKIINLTNHETGNILVYPNPVNDILSLSGVNIGQKILLSDVNGKLLQQINITQASLEIDMSIYSNGLYFLKIDNGRTIKLIKK